jgi:hypothetical protein
MIIIYPSHNSYFYMIDLSYSMNSHSDLLGHLYQSLDSQLFQIQGLESNIGLSLFFISAIKISYCQLMKI